MASVRTGSTATVIFRFGHEGVDTAPPIPHPNVTSTLSYKPEKKF